MLGEPPRGVVVGVEARRPLALGPLLNASARQLSPARHTFSIG
jgi:hypothetical protein